MKGSSGSRCGKSCIRWLSRGSDGGRFLCGTGGAWLFSGVSSKVPSDSDEPNTDEPNPLVDEPNMLPLDELNKDAEVWKTQNNQTTLISKVSKVRSLIH